MGKTPNKLWAFGPPISLLLLAFAYYVKVPSFRDTVDAHFPWVKEHLAQFVPEPTVVMIKDPANPETPDRPNPGDPSLAAHRRTGNPKPQATPTPTPEEPLTMERFAANPNLWPKKVKLRKTIDFPAVLNGRKVGMIKVPAGTETNLVKVQNQQLGVEYQGGGAWVPIGETDLMDQVKITSRAGKSSLSISAPVFLLAKAGVKAQDRGRRVDRSAHPGSRPVFPCPTPRFHPVRRAKPQRGHWHTRCNRSG